MILYFFCNLPTLLSFFIYVLPNASQIQFMIFFKIFGIFDLFLWLLTGRSFSFSFFFQFIDHFQSLKDVCFNFRTCSSRSHVCLTHIFGSFLNFKWNAVRRRRVVDVQLSLLLHLLERRYKNPIKLECPSSSSFSSSYPISSSIFFGFIGFLYFWWSFFFSKKMRCFLMTTISFILLISFC